MGIGIEVLSSLFLRPDAVIFKQQLLQQQQKVAAAAAAPVKAVGFNMDQVQTFGDSSWDNGSGHGDNYDEHDDDGGTGYDMGGGGDDGEVDGGDFFVQELDNVRKVEKVSVGYATVAKKVDVKRLKRDLWAEIESHFDSKGNGSDVEEKDDDDNDDDNNNGATTTATASNPHSFQQAVKEMEANKTQMDVTLPYYFICLLHLANEHNLRLESKGLDDFEIHLDNNHEM
jgi:condensin complex subunit 2